jgi:hypothetical protein
MQAVLRKYSGAGATALFDVLAKNVTELERTMRAVRGLVSYTLVRTSDGGYSVTVCQDKAGLDESVQIAKAWIAKNAAHVGAAAPEVVSGGVVMHVK